MDLSISSVENDDFNSDNSIPSSLPIYQGSILSIEKHPENRNLSDLIVRISNFQHQSFPWVRKTNGIHSSDEQQFNESDSQQDAHIKRRAPLPLPVTSDDFPRSTVSEPNLRIATDESHAHPTEPNSRLLDTRRLTNGLRHLSRTLAATCKSKQSFSAHEVPHVPMMPDVEVMPGKIIIPHHVKKVESTSTSHLNASKLIPPKILCIKRKYFKTKQKGSGATNDEERKTKNPTPPSSHYRQNVSFMTKDLDELNRMKSSDSKERNYEG